MKDTAASEKRCTDGELIPFISSSSLVLDSAVAIIYRRWILQQHHHHQSALPHFYCSLYLEPTPP